MKSGETSCKGYSEIHESRRYPVIWEDCRNNSRVADRFFVPGYKGYLPFFLSDEELAVFERKEKVELREEHLLKGILYGLYEFDHHPKSFHQRSDRKTLLYLLNVLRSGFEFKSIEEMVLDVASNMRQEEGNGASRIVLEVGSELVPRSSKIKSHLIFDLWATISDKSDEAAHLERVVALVAQTELNEIHPDAREIVCYYGFCATVFLNRRYYAPSYLEKYIYPNVSTPGFKRKIMEFLENPERFTPQDLRVI